MRSTIREAAEMKNKETMLYLKSCNLNRALCVPGKPKVNLGLLIQEVRLIEQTII